MLKFINKHVITIITLIVCNVVSASNAQHTNFMLEPNGNYGIGYQDIFLINTEICPDGFYKINVNDNEFSANNKKHCHEIALRVYYPATNTKELHDEYYKPHIDDNINWLH